MEEITEYTVSRLSALIKNTLEKSFSDIVLRAEISSLKASTLGHVYLSLKDSDSDSVINAVCWKGIVQKSSVKLEVGMEMRFFGNVTTYPTQSKYNFQINRFEIAGLGELLKMLEERKKKLAAEGLFDSSKKKKIPTLPRLIGVVTSPTGAVIKDILRTVNRRFPREILLWPVQVQGVGAAHQIADAIRGMNALQGNMHPDVLIVARGGGSFEDLMPFSEEEVVRAAAASEIPLISGVGHETDTTLIDYAADLRAPTPTAAAELAVPEKVKLQHDVSKIFLNLHNAIQNYIEKQKLFLNSHKVLSIQGFISERAQKTEFAFDKISSKIKDMISARSMQLVRMNPLPPKIPENIGEIFQRLSFAFTSKYEANKNAFALLVNSMEANSYSKILKKGFAFVESDKAEPLTSAKKTQAAAAFNLVFADGSVRITKKSHQMDLF